MKTAPLPSDERERLAALRAYGILDTAPETAFDGLVQLASFICKTPIAAISLVDEHRQWFKAICGLDARETSRDVAFCAHAILQPDPLVVPDATRDERFHDNPLVSGAPDIRFYAGVPLVTADGRALGTLCVIDREPREIAAEQLDAVKVLASSVVAQLDLRLTNERIRRYAADLQLAASFFEATNEAMIVTDAENRIVSVNPAFTVLTGYTLEEVVGRDPKMLSSGRQSPEFYRRMWTSLETEGRWNGELWNRRKNGDVYAEWLSISVLHDDDGGTRLYLAIFSDITARKHADEQIWRHANFDQLTQLPNRRLFRDRLEQELLGARRDDYAIALLYVDLDSFKPINDTMGHDAGDEVLVAAAQRIRACLRESDTVARMGGDEFTVILAPIDHSGAIERVPQAILESLAQPLVVGGAEISLSASIGIAVCPAHGAEPVELLRNADRAMYQAKSKGRSRFEYYDL